MAKILNTYDNTAQKGGGFMGGSIQHDTRTGKPYIKIYWDSAYSRAIRPLIPDDSGR